MRAVALTVLVGCFSAPPRPSENGDPDGGPLRRDDGGGTGDSTLVGPCVDDDFDTTASRECGDWADQFGFGLTLARNGALTGAHDGADATLACTSTYFDFTAGARIQIVNIPSAPNGSLGMKVETTTNEFLAFTLKGGSMPMVVTSDHGGIEMTMEHTNTPYFRIITDNSKENLVVERSSDELVWSTVAPAVHIPAGVRDARVQLFMSFGQGVVAGTAGFDNLKTCP